MKGAFPFQSPANGAKIEILEISWKVIRGHKDFADELNDISSFNIPDSLKNYLMYEDELRIYLNTIYIF